MSNKKKTLAEKMKDVSFDLEQHPAPMETPAKPPPLRVVAKQVKPVPKGRKISGV